MTDTDLQTLTDARRELPDTDRSWSANLMRLAYAEIQFARAAEAMAEGFRSIGAVNVTVDDPEAGRRSSLAAYEELARGGHAGARRIVERDDHDRRGRLATRGEPPCQAAPSH